MMLSFARLEAFFLSDRLCVLGNGDLFCCAFGIHFTLTIFFLVGENTRVSLLANELNN